LILILVWLIAAPQALDLLRCVIAPVRPVENQLQLVAAFVQLQSCCIYN
jgi:hypothetical protein